MGPHFPAKSAKIAVLYSLFEPPGVLISDLPDPAETQHAQPNLPWVPHAGGQDDGSYNKLPQIKQTLRKTITLRFGLGLCGLWI